MTRRFWFAVAAVLLATAAVLGVALAVPHHSTPGGRRAAQEVAWWPYSTQVAGSLRFVGVGPQGTYFAGREVGLSPVQLARRLEQVGWHAATILDGSKVVGGVSLDHGHRIWWGASK